MSLNQPYPIAPPCVSNIVSEHKIDLPSASVPIEAFHNEFGLTKYYIGTFCIKGQMINVCYSGSWPTHQYLTYAYTSKCVNCVKQYWPHAPINCPETYCIYCNKRGHWDHNCRELTKLILS